MAFFNASDYFIWLSEICGAGSSLPKRIYQCFDGDMKSAYEAELDEYIARGIGKDEAKVLLDKDFTRANSIVDYCAENRVGVLCFCSEYYPKRLFDIENPPPVLYCKGRIERLKESAAITAIGSRKCTEAAYESGYSFSYKLASAGVNIVTGLAQGIDTACTLGALDAGGFSVGVLGSGINILYPFENRSVFSRMFKSGLVITEFSPFTEPKGINFPIRNRIMAALGDGVLVVEARKGSGALITAKYAKDAGKRIFVMPGSVNDPKCRRSNELIREGPLPVIEVSDILSHLEYSYPDTVSVRRSGRLRLKERDGYLSRRKRRQMDFEKHLKKTGEPEKDADLCDMKDEVLPEKQALPKEKVDLSILSPCEKAIYEYIKKGKTTADIIGRELQIDQSEVSIALTMLEIYELIISLPGGTYEAVSE